MADAPTRTTRSTRADYLRGKFSRGRLLRRVGSRIAGQLYLDRGGGPEDAVFLAGSARAGTTWISDVINHRRDHRYVFEPFHPNRLELTKGFLPRQYLRPDDDDPRYVDPARAILSGEVRSLWTDKYNHARLARKRLVKEVRGNLLVAWLRRHFPETPVVFVLRHPCAVAASQLDLNWNWHLNLPRMLEQPHLAEDHLEPYRDLLTAEHTPFERHVLLWCVENYVPLRQLRPGQAHLMLYEHAVSDPEAELRALFGFLGREFDPAVLGGLSRPSAVSRRTSAVVTGGSLTGSWRERVSGAEAARAVELIARFGLDRVYGEEPMPRIERAADALLTS